MLKLWLIEADTHGYDVYQGAVVVSGTEEGAKNIHPGSSWECKHTWVDSPDKVSATYLGAVSSYSSYKEGDVVITDFYAG